jgi:hypothetical protein
MVVFFFSWRGIDEMRAGALYPRMIAQGRIRRGGFRTSVFLVLALIASLLVAPAWARDSPGKCRAPVAWRIGVVDREFGIAPQKLHRMARAAALRWNQLAATVVLIDRPNVRFTINLRYGLRQETAETIKDLHADAAHRKAMLDDLIRVMDKLVHKHNIDSARYAAKVDAFNRTAERFVARRKQRISNPARRQLRDEHEVLNKRQTTLDKEKNQLDDARSQIETLRDEIKTRAMRHNNTVAAANRTMKSFPDDARKVGVTHINGPRSKIDLLQYYDDDKMYLTLLHEFGHALGLEHITDPRAIMYPTQNAKTANDLTANDVKALRALC